MALLKKPIPNLLLMLTGWKLFYLFSAQTDGGGKARERPLGLEEEDVCRAPYPVKGASLRKKVPNIALPQLPDLLLQHLLRQRWKLQHPLGL